MVGRKEFKILCIDGGGIKGLYSASVLAKIEEYYEKSISDHFDMICGTSTGGLIALGLTAGLPAQEMADLYYFNGRHIFPTSKFSLIRVVYRELFRQTMFKGKWSNESLRHILEEKFGEKTLGDAMNLLCIPSFNLNRGMPRVFKFPHKESGANGFFMDKKIKMVDAALATSAAPTYLPIHEVSDTLYIDGGVWANNPTLCGLLEALDYFVGADKEFDSYSILSISSINQPTGWNSTNNKKRSFLGWREKLFQTSMDGQSYFTHFFMSKITKYTKQPGFYYRIPSPDLSKEQQKAIQMDNTLIKVLKTLKAIGEHDGYTEAIKPEISRFFDSPKIYKTN